MLFYYFFTDIYFYLAKYPFRIIERKQIGKALNANCID